MSTTPARLSSALSDRYRVERELGQGGMATVYLARDLRHDRLVALKLLRPELAAVIGGERFLAEIKVTAHLQHPHILPLFDSGEVDGLLYYVMPYVEGESLRTRLEREKQLGLAEALRITTEVAGALDYAHRHGVVHRDIKPENVLLHDGTALVADFGIALAATNAGATRMTATGMSLGTPAYMSPEQAMGDREVDARSDIYSLGTMLYEMLVGDPPYMGSTAQAIVAKVLTEKPVPITVHRDTVPANVTAAVQKALNKLPADRFSTAAEFAKALGTPEWGVGEPLATRPMAGVATRTRRMPRGALAAVLAATALAAGALGWMLRPEPARPVRRYEILTQGFFGGVIALSPDGSVVVAGGRGADTTLSLRSLWVRRLDQLEVARLTGLAGIPFFSPDGKEIGIIADGKLLRAGLEGSAPQVVGDSASRLGWWGDDGYIYYTGQSWGLVRRPAAGGPAEAVTTIDENLNEIHGRPQLLPSGKAVLFTSWRGLGGDAEHQIMAFNLASREIKPVIRGFSAIYGGGQIVFGTSDGSLVHAPFDPDRLEVTGTTQVVTGSLRSVDGFANIQLARNGTLVYQMGGAALSLGRPLSVVSRSGLVRSLPLPQAAYTSVRLSPSGDRLAYEVNQPNSDGGDVFVLRMGDSVPVRLTVQGVNSYPTWTPDGRRLAYARLQGGERDLAWQAADGSDGPTVLLARPGPQFEVEFVPEGRMLVRDGNASATGSDNLDLLAFRVGSDTATPFVAAPRVLERSPRISPDGRWVAYASNQSGRSEVFVRPWPDQGTGAVWQVSAEGGSEPVWARSGRELFFKSQGALFSAEVRTTPSFAVGARRRLFLVAGYLNNDWHARYDVLPGDSTFVMIGSGITGQEIRTVVVENWLREVQ